MPGQWEGGICDSIGTGLLVLPSTGLTGEHNSHFQKRAVTTKSSEILTFNKDINLGLEIVIWWGVIADAGEVTGVVSYGLPDDEQAAALPRGVVTSTYVHTGVLLLVLAQGPAYGMCSPVNTTHQNER